MFISHLDLRHSKVVHESKVNNHTCLANSVVQENSFELVVLQISDGSYP